MESISKEISIQELMKMDISLSCIEECRILRKIGKQKLFNIKNLDYPELNAYIEAMGYLSEEDKINVFQTLLSNIQPYMIIKDERIGKNRYIIQVANSFSIAVHMNNDMLDIQRYYSEYIFIDDLWVPVFPSCFISGVDEEYDMIEININCGLSTYPIQVKGKPLRDMYIVKMMDIYMALNDTVKKVSAFYSGFPDIHTLDSVDFLINKINEEQNQDVKIYLDMILENTIYLNSFSNSELLQLKYLSSDNEDYKKYLKKRIHILTDRKEVF